VKTKWHLALAVGDIHLKQFSKKRLPIQTLNLRKTAEKKNTKESEEDIKEGIESNAPDTSNDNNQQQQPHGVDHSHE